MRYFLNTISIYKIVLLPKTINIITQNDRISI